MVTSLRYGRLFSNDFITRCYQVYQQKELWKMGQYFIKLWKRIEHHLFYVQFLVLRSGKQAFPKHWNNFQMTCSLHWLLNWKPICQNNWSPRKKENIEIYNLKSEIMKNLPTISYNMQPITKSCLSRKLVAVTVLSQDTARLVAISSISVSRKQSSVYIA